MEKSLLDLENRMKNVLNDSENDTKFIRSKLEKAIADLEAKVKCRQFHKKWLSTITYSLLGNCKLKIDTNLSVGSSCQGNVNRIG